MSKNPFGEYVEKYLDIVKFSLAETTFQVLERRYRRMEYDFKTLYNEKKISTMSPVKMKPEDIKAYLTYRLEKKVGSSDYNHDISALRHLLQNNGNGAVDICMHQYPALKMKSRQKRLKPLPDSTYLRILEKYKEVDHFDFTTVRAFALVLMYIGTGARNKELRLADIGDLDTSSRTIYYAHVKGEDSYGEPRTVPIPEEIMPVVLDYLNVRSAWLISHRATSAALFFAMNGEYDHLSGNSIRKIKTHVEEAIGERFELRDCRRAFGQIYLNKGLPLDSVSRMMGHETTMTTELYYCAKKQEHVIEEAKKLW